MSQINWKLHNALNTFSRGWLPKNRSAEVQVCFLLNIYVHLAWRKACDRLFWTAELSFSETDLQRSTLRCISGGLQIFFWRNICCCCCWIFVQVSLTKITIMITCLLFTFEGVLCDRMFAISSHFISFHLVLATALRTQIFEKWVKRDESSLVFILKKWRFQILERQQDFNDRAYNSPRTEQA